jgi:hypothetical protein
MFLPLTPEKTINLILQCSDSLLLEKSFALPYRANLFYGLSFDCALSKSSLLFSPYPPDTLLLSQFAVLCIVRSKIGADMRLVSDLE